MRPRKILLLVDADDQRRSERAYVLELKGYRVLQAESGETALRLIEESRGKLQTVELIIVRGFPPKMSMVRLYDLTSTALLYAAEGYDGKEYFLSINSNVTAMGTLSSFLEAVRLLTICKRGPKPRSKPVTASADE